MKFSWESTKKPIVALAPMEGYTDSAFRQIVKSVAPETVVFTEFSSADAIKYKSKKTLAKIGFTPAEQPLIVQIFGNKSESFAKAVKIIEATGVAGIDINMGCPAAKVISSEHGSALIKAPHLAAELVATIRENTNVPVSVKTRLGYESADLDHFFSFCQDLINAGATCLTIHGRTTKQKFSGMSNWDPIYELKRRQPNTTIIGCGDITSADQALEKIKNLDGVMVGRATFGNPWIMGEIEAAFNNTTYQRPQTFIEKIPLILKHCELNVETKGERVGMLQIRKHLAVYIREIDNASKYRQQLVRVESMDEVKRIFDEIVADLG